MKLKVKLRRAFDANRKIWNIFIFQPDTQISAQGRFLGLNWNPGRISGSKFNSSPGRKNPGWKFPGRVARPVAEFRTYIRIYENFETLVLFFLHFTIFETILENSDIIIWEAHLWCRFILLFRMAEKLYELFDRKSMMGFYRF